MGLFFMIILGQVNVSSAPQGPTRFEHLAGARNMFLFQNQKQGGGILNESNNNLIILIHLHLPNKLESSLSICDLHKLKRLKHHFHKIFFFHIPKMQIPIMNFTDIINQPLQLYTIMCFAMGCLLHLSIKFYITVSYSLA